MNSTKLCPNNSFVYNTILCSCNPGLMLNHTSNICEPLQIKGSEGDFLVGSGVDGEDPSLTFPATIFDFESVKKFTQSQAVFLEATIVVVLIWLLMCFFFRFRKLGDGRGIWFRIRWWISRLDTCFATRHWLTIIMLKRGKQSLGVLSQLQVGCFSVAYLPLSFLADVGGLYFFSICIFFILLVQCEYRFKTLREEDTILGRIRNRGKAQDHWDKVRKYVMYTWNVRASIKDDNKATRKHSCIPKLMEKKLLPKLHTHVPKQHQNELVQLNFNRNQAR